MLTYLADILIDTYASESALLRAQARGVDGSATAELQARRRRRLRSRGRGRIELAARHCLAAMAEGDVLRTQLAALRRLLKVDARQHRRDAPAAGRRDRRQGRVSVLLIAMRVELLASGGWGLATEIVILRSCVRSLDRPRARGAHRSGGVLAAASPRTTRRRSPRNARRRTRCSAAAARTRRSCQRTSTSSCRCPTFRSTSLCRAGAAASRAAERVTLQMPTSTGKLRDMTRIGTLQFTSRASRCS